MSCFIAISSIIVVYGENPFRNADQISFAVPKVATGTNRHYGLVATLYPALFIRAVTESVFVPNRQGAGVTVHTTTQTTQSVD